MVVMVVVVVMVMVVMVIVVVMRGYDMQGTKGLFLSFETLGSKGLLH